MCVFRVMSRIASFDSFLLGTTLPVYNSHRKGEHRKYARKEVLLENYGFSCAVSEKDLYDLKGQIADAIDFIKRHRSELKNLVANHQVDDIRLDFPIASRLNADVLGQHDYLPPELIREAGELGIGIGLSTYACSEDPIDDHLPEKS